MTLSSLPPNVVTGTVVRFQWTVPKNQEMFKFRLISVTQEAFGDSPKAHYHGEKCLNRRDLDGNNPIRFYHSALKDSVTIGLYIYRPKPDLKPANPNNIFKPIEPHVLSDAGRVNDWVVIHRFIEPIQSEEPYTICLVTHDL